MPPMLARPYRYQILAAAILVTSVLLAWLAYSPGIAGSLQFDDYGNLGGLSNVRDPWSAITFIAEGKAGPLGRPIALASFAAEAYAWPDAPSVFLRTNILIHLLNGMLVAWLLYLVSLARSPNNDQAALVGVASSAIWMVMPLLASSSLMIVQRMTTLSATFMLAAGIAYFYFRQRSETWPLIALTGMSVSLALGVFLGVFTKESGALLFAYILAVEATLLRRPVNISKRLWRSWFTAVLIFPVTCIVAYLALRLPYPEGLILRRDFSGIERLITQAEILWKYLYLAFLPNVPALGPFHDDYAVQRSLLNPAALLSVLGWAAVIVAAIRLRNKAPFFTFAVAWYLLGHILESTTVALELYFEHRNYFPLIGPVYALVHWTIAKGTAYAKLRGFALAGYFAILTVTLYSTTALWGAPSVAAEMWQIYKPESVRAVQNLSFRLSMDDDPWTSRRVLAEFYDSNPELHGIKLQILNIDCRLEPDRDFGGAVDFLEKEFTTTPYNQAIHRFLQSFYKTIRDYGCAGIEEEAVYRLATSLLENPHYKSGLIRHNLHVILARMATDRKDFSRTVEHLEKAVRSYSNLMTLAALMDVLISGGHKDAALQLLEEARDWDVPPQPLRAVLWQRQLEAIESVLLKMTSLNETKIRGCAKFEKSRSV